MLSLAMTLHFFPERIIASIFGEQFSSTPRDDVALHDGQRHCERSEAVSFLSSRQAIHIKPLTAFAPRLIRELLRPIHHPRRAIQCTPHARRQYASYVLSNATSISADARINSAPAASNSVYATYPKAVRYIHFGGRQDQFSTCGEQFDVRHVPEGSTPHPFQCTPHAIQHLRRAIRLTPDARKHDASPRLPDATNNSPSAT
jgi:hypothetical protein